MTVTKTYRCDLCRVELSPTLGAQRQGFGLHYQAYSPPKAGPWLTFKRTDECERHICVDCARAVHDELRRVLPAPAQG